MGEPIVLWLFEYTDQFGKRRITQWRLTEAEAREQLKDPVRLEHSRFVVEGVSPCTSAWLPHK
jgi:hypothetical protein